MGEANERTTVPDNDEPKVMLALKDLEVMSAELTRLHARVDELLEHNTALVMQRRATLRAQVREFYAANAGKHEQFDMPGCPMVPDDGLVRLRLRLITEEFFELLQATFVCSQWADGFASVCGVVQALIKEDTVRIDVPEFVDALADLDYVVEGTRIAFGVDGAPIAAEVQRSNMAKLGGTVREDGKVLKPPNWTPPDIAGELRKQGWKG